MPHEKPFLKGKNVSLHVLRESDAEHMLAWLHDEEVRSFIRLVHPVSETEEREFLQRQKDRRNTDQIFGIVTADGKYVGNMGVHEINHLHGTATTGALIGVPEYRGKGLGTEAKMILLNYLFNHLNLRKIYSRVYDFNGRSRRYSEKCGYEPEGTLKADTFKDGRYLDVHILAVFRETWLPLWEKFRHEHGM